MREMATTISPAHRGRAAEPMYYLLDIVENPGFYSWVTILRMAEAMMATLTLVPEPECEEEEPPTPLADASPSTPQGVEAGLELGQVQSEVPPGTSGPSGLEGNPPTPWVTEEGEDRICFNPESTSCGFSGGDIPPDWVVALSSYNEFFDRGTYSYRDFRLSYPDLPIPWKVRECLFDRLSSLRATALSRILGKISRMYGSPGLNSRWYFQIGNARFRLETLYTFIYNT